MIDLDLFSNSSRDVAMATKFGQIGKMTFIQQADVPKRVGIWQFWFKIFNGNIVATSCAILIKIGPVTPEIARVTPAPFWTRQQKSSYPNEYLGKY